MKKNILLLSFICLSVNSLSQNLVDNFITNFKNNPTLKQLKQEFILIEDQKFYVANFEFDDEFDTKKIVANFQYQNFWYSIKAWAKSDSIFILQITKNGSLKDSVINSIYKFIDSSSAYNYLQKHNLKYSTASNIQDFFSYEMGTFGIGCGFVGQTPEAMEECLKIIKVKNIKKLLSLATSIHTTNRAYGVFGLFVLKKQGFDLTSNDEILIQVNQQSKAMSFSCEGCLYGTESLLGLLTPKKLKNYFDWYLRVEKLY